MDLKTFFENFDAIAQAPGGVKRLRELILDSAVRGKLVEQDKNDEPALTQVKNALAERKRLTETKKIRKRKQQAPLESDEAPFQAPDGWEFIRLGEITDIASGVTKGRKLANRETKFYAYLRVANVQRGSLDLNVIKEIEIPTEELDKYRLQYGDVLLTEGGDWDKLGRSTIWRNEIEDCIHQNHVFRARVLAGSLLPEWISSFTNSLTGRRYFESAAKRTTNLASINMTQLRFCPFPVPPLAEQKRIVAKVDELMALCDEVEAAQQSRHSLQQKLRASALDALMNAPTDEALSSAWAFVSEHWDELCQRSEDVEDLRQTVLQMGIKGKLVSQDSNDEAASKLVRLAIAEKSRLVEAKKIKKRKPQAELEPEEIPFSMPQNWSCSRLGDILDIASGVTKGRKLAGREIESYPYLRVANVQRGSLNLSVMKEIEIPVEELDKYRLQKGDVLLTEGGDWDKLGRSAIWQGQIEDCIHQNHVFRARVLAATLLPEWVSMFTNSAVGRRYFESAAKRTTNLASINMTQLRFCPFPVPPLAEQQRIVAKVEQLMTLCDSLQTHLQQRQQTAQALATRLTQLSH